MSSRGVPRLQRLMVGILLVSCAGLAVYCRYVSMELEVERTRAALYYETLRKADVACVLNDGTWDCWRLDGVVGDQHSYWESGFEQQ